MSENTKTQSDQKPEGSLLASWRRANEIAALMGVLLILIGLPIFFRDYYFDILDVKYYYYCASVILMIAAVLVIGIVFWMRDRKYYDGANVRYLRSQFSLRSLSWADWGMIGFVAAAAISTFQSDYFFESFWGNEGRFCGLFLILLYGISFFIIGKCLRFKDWYVDVFLGAGMVVCLVGILHYFYLDPIGFKAQISPNDYEIFTSTIGNINTYTSYIALVTGASAVMFAVETNRYKKVWYTICLVVSLFALITGISDNAYLALFGLLGLLPLYLFRNVRGIRNYIVILAVLCTEFLVIQFLELHLEGQVQEIDGIFNVISGLSVLPVLTGALWVLAGVLFGLERKPKIGAWESNTGRYIWLAVVIVVAAGICFVLYDANIGGNGSRYGALQAYVVIDDSWGTNRGYIWRLAMRLYKDFPLHHKIFGYGPDTFGILTVTNYYDEMNSLYGMKFESVHNEYLQYVITTGIVGAIAYVNLLVSSVVRMVRKSGKNHAVMAMVFAVICYGVQAVVNISVPIVAPLMLTLIMVGLSHSKGDV